MLKIGLVGVGGISGAHIPAWEEIKEVELVALCDIRQERLDQYPKKRHYNDFKEMLEKKLSHNFGVTPEQASDDIFYKATVLVLLDIMSERKAKFKKAVDEQESKTIYYLSMEFLMGRSLKNNLYNLDLTETMRKVLKNYKVNLDNLFLLPSFE